MPWLLGSKQSDINLNSLVFLLQMQISIYYVRSNHRYIVKQFEIQWSIIFYIINHLNLRNHGLHSFCALNYQSIYFDITSSCDSIFHTIHQNVTERKRNLINNNCSKGVYFYLNSFMKNRVNLNQPLRDLINFNIVNINGYLFHRVFHFVLPLLNFTTKPSNLMRY